MNSRKFHQYTITENGEIYNTETKRCIKKSLNKGKYEVSLFIDGKIRVYLFNRLYYFLFVKQFNMDDKNLCVVTKDGNWINFSKENLVLKKRKDILQGEKTKRAKLTNKQVEEIRALYKGQACTNQYDKGGGDVSYQDLADKYGVSKANIGKIIRGEARNELHYKLK